MSISLRIRELAEIENIPIARLEKIIGVGNGSILTLLKRNSNISGDLLVKFLSSFPKLNANWLVMGIGDMYLSENLQEKKICRDCVITKRSIQDAQELLSIYRNKVSEIEEKLAVCEKKARTQIAHPPKIENKL